MIYFQDAMKTSYDFTNQRTMYAIYTSGYEDEIIITDYNKVGYGQQTSKYHP